MSTAETVIALELKREKLKTDLFAKYAQKERRKELWICYQEGTPIEERIALDSEIAILEAERQETKVKLMQLKAEARKHRDKLLMPSLIALLEQNGMREQVNAVMTAANDQLKQVGLYEAYASKL